MRVIPHSFGPQTIPASSIKFEASVIVVAWCRQVLVASTKAKLRHVLVESSWQLNWQSWALSTFVSVWDKEAPAKFLSYL